MLSKKPHTKHAMSGMKNQPVTHWFVSILHSIPLLWKIVSVSSLQLTVYMKQWYKAMFFFSRK